LIALTVTVAAIAVLIATKRWMTAGAPPLIHGIIFGQLPVSSSYVLRSQSRSAPRHVVDHPFKVASADREQIRVRRAVHEVIAYGMPPRTAKLHRIHVVAESVAESDGIARMRASNSGFIGGGFCT